MTELAGRPGSPTRGRLDVLPTGRNFYSVDPRALPSELSYATGVKLAVIIPGLVDTALIPHNKHLDRALMLV